MKVSDISSLVRVLLPYEQFASSLLQPRLMLLTLLESSLSSTDYNLPITGTLLEVFPITISPTKHVPLNRGSYPFFSRSHGSRPSSETLYIHLFLFFFRFATHGKAVTIHLVIPHEKSSAFPFYTFFGW